MEITFIISKIAGIASLAFASLASFQPAQAGTFHHDWYYVEDSFEDSTQGNLVGGTNYEQYRWAWHQTNDKIYMAFESNISFDGINTSIADDGHIGFGSILFNFTGDDLTTASNNGELIGIQISEQNDSNVSSTGVWTNVTAKTVASENGNTLANLADYNSWVRSQGKTPSMGDVGADDPYFDQDRHVQNVIASGTKAGEVYTIEGEMLGHLGLDFSRFGTVSNILGISFDADLLPDGDFIAHWGLECNNDIMAMIHTKQEVPEALGGFGLLALTVAGILSKRRLLKI